MTTFSPNRLRPRLPPYLKQTIPHGSVFQKVQSAILNQQLNTVCEAAKCPNRTHCYARGTLTFQILGNICTRACGFCAETFGKPGAIVDANEPQRVVETARLLQLKHVVITSPARDDLDDDGANQFVKVIQLFRELLPNVTVEILTPDFRAKPDCLNLVFSAKPDIFNHNIETVRRLSPKVRSKATYDRTLHVLNSAVAAELVTKSGFMVGHGEYDEEIIETMKDLKNAGVSLLTIGQYLPPSHHHLPLIKMYIPEEFDALKSKALDLGFKNVAAGALVRSSYHADLAAEEALSK